MVLELHDTILYLGSVPNNLLHIHLSYNHMFLYGLFINGTNIILTLFKMRHGSHRYGKIMPLLINQTQKMNRIKKRFVAGAKCPKCQAQDSIVLFKENGIETVECVECDYREQQTDDKVSDKATGEVIGLFKPE